MRFNPHVFSVAVLGGNNRAGAVSLFLAQEDTMSERPSLGWSAISKLETSRSAWERLSRLVFLVIGIVVMAVVFLWLTDSAQKSTAHATGPDGLHYDSNAP